MDSTKEHNNTQRILSFCYGYGGLERGISKVIPTRVAAYVEIEAFQNFNLVAAMESGMVDKAPIWTDLKTFDARPFHNRIHGIVGGYPCQGESHAGKRELWNDERFLWPYIEKAIVATNPFWCFFENVSGHLTGSFPYILDSLRTLGYTVEAGLFTADEVGAPHERKRTFILALGNTEYNGCSTIKKLRSDETTSDIWRKKKSKSTRQSKRAGGRINAKGVSRCSIGSQQKLGDSKRILLQGRGSRQGQEQSRGASNELSYPSNNGNGESSKEHQTEEFIQNGDKWPAKRGQSQHKWEAPRTVEPGVGCTVNGYNFRTELLRQYGNGVVSQQASLAFETLLDKLTNSK